MYHYPDARGVGVAVQYNLSPAAGSESVGQIDHDSLLVIAYAVGVGVVQRHALGDPNAQDVPIGAVAYDVTTGKAYTGYPRDRELDDRTAHAERQAHGHAQQDGAESGNLKLVTTFEPCPDCFGWMADAGIPDVTYVTDRAALETKGLLKTHGLKVPDLARLGREGSPYPEFRQVADPVLQAAFLALFGSFRRDPVTEKVTYDPSLEAPPLPDLTQTINGATNGELTAALVAARLHLSSFFALPEIVAPS